MEKRMRRRSALIALAAAGLAAIPDRSFAQNSLTKIRIAGTPTDAFTSVFYAIKSGMYKNAGLDVEFVPVSSGSAATAAVVGGAYEFGNTSLNPVFAAHLSGVPIVIAVPQSVYTAQNPFGLLQVAPDSTVRKAADLNGKTIGVFGLGDLGQVAVLTWMDKNGGDTSSLKFTEIPFGASPEAVATHRVDAMVLLEPLLDISMSEDKTRTLADVFGTISKSFMIGAYIARPDWLDAHADVARRFRRVTEQANMYANGHTAETAEIVAEATKIPLAVVQKMRRVAFTRSLDPSLFQPLIDLAAKYHFLARSFPANELLWNDR
jgi:NitT/TauT family transport system substrate-binding protein